MDKFGEQASYLARKNDIQLPLSHNSCSYNTY